ncbi:MAG: hypothetical protein Q7T82_05920 [Armatimonadota bacterium]|nr:hypothetical protein [Armatimonadota bacterium]
MNADKRLSALNDLAMNDEPGVMLSKLKQAIFLGCGEGRRRSPECGYSSGSNV